MLILIVGCSRYLLKFLSSPLISSSLFSFPHLSSPHLSSPLLSSSHLISSHLIFSYLILSRCAVCWSGVCTDGVHPGGLSARQHPLWCHPRTRASLYLPRNCCLLFHSVYPDYVGYLNVVVPVVMCRQISNISHTKSQNCKVSRLVLQLYLSNPLKPGVKLRRKM